MTPSALLWLRRQPFLESRHDGSWRCRSFVVDAQRATDISRVMKDDRTHYHAVPDKRMPKPWEGRRSNPDQPAGPALGHCVSADGGRPAPADSRRLEHPWFDRNFRCQHARGSRATGEVCSADSHPSIDGVQHQSASDSPPGPDGSSSSHVSSTQRMRPSGTVEPSAQDMV